MTSKILAILFEILIFRGYSSSTTHPIEIDSEKKVIALTYIITNFKLYEAPLTEDEGNFFKRKSKFRFLFESKKLDLNKFKINNI